MILAGDIGGTSTRLAYFEVNNGRVLPKLVMKYPSVQYAGLEDIVHTFVSTHTPETAVQHAGFGIAGPVSNGRVQTPNLPWVVEANLLAQELNLPAVSLLNDLEANTWGILALKKKDLAVINPGAPDATGNIAVISAGTGLGEGYAVWDADHQRYQVFASEGGHSDFAPQDELEVELLLFLRRRFNGHVSCERIVSGPGLRNIYDFLRATGRGEEEEWLHDAMKRGDPSAVIARAGMDGSSPLCAQALDLFVSVFGAEAGNLALKIMSAGGVYIGGGIAPKLVEKIKAGGFMQAFIAKGRHQRLLEAMPVRVVLNEDTALLGAARYAAIKSGLVQAG
jgi:glucokinase